MAPVVLTMKYIIYSFLFIVISASAVHAPQVFAFTLNFEKQGSEFHVTNAPGRATYGYSYPPPGYNCNVYAAPGDQRLDAVLLPGGIPLPDGTYFVYNFASTTCQSFLPDNSDGDGYFTVSGGLIIEQGPISSFEVTRIVSFIPANGSTVATGTQPVGFTAYIKEDDFEEDTRLSFIVRSLGYSGTENSVSFDSEFLYLDSAGEHTYTEEIDLNIQGQYTMSAWIEQPTFSFFGWPILYDRIVASTSSFTVGESSLLDLNDDIFDIIAAGLASTTLNIGETCSPLSDEFSFHLCVLGAILPPSEVIQTNINNLLSLPPWGWGFRFYNILSGLATTSTTTMPMISYTFGTTSIMYQSGLTTIHLDPFRSLSEANNFADSVVSDQETPKTIREIMESTIRIIAYLGLLIVVIRKIFGIEWHDSYEETQTDYIPNYGKNRFEVVGKTTISRNKFYKSGYYRRK